MKTFWCKDPRNLGFDFECCESCHDGEEEYMLEQEEDDILVVHCCGARLLDWDEVFLKLRSILHQRSL